MKPRLVVDESEMPKADDICGQAIDLINSETAASKNISIATIFVASGRRSMKHYHRKMEETYYIVEGTGKVTIGNRCFVVGPGSACYLPVGKWHQVENTGKSVLKLISADSPSFDPSDIHR